MLDDVRLTLIPGFVAVVFGVILLAIFAYMNTGSRNISFAVAALAGAIVMLFLNLLFDLQGKRKPLYPPTIDVRMRRIRQWIYPLSLGDRYTTETKASTEAFQINPEMFTRDNGEKLAHNMIIFSILSYLIFERHDGQTKKDVVAYSNRTVTQMEFTSKPDSCTIVTYDELRKSLLDSGNIFSTFKWYSPFNSVCLPPGTSISVTLSSVTVSNAFCKIVFDVERSGGLPVT